MKEIIETIYPMGTQLLGAGYNSALEYINHLIPLEVFEYPSGSHYGSWEVPEEWIIRDGWVKFKGEKIIDYQKDKLSVVVGSLPISKKVDLTELQAHLHYSLERPQDIPYVYKFYDKDWGFCVPTEKIKKPGEAPVAEIRDGELVDPQFFRQGWIDTLEEGEYEVFIDSEYRPSKMKIGVHTIPGKSKREIWLFAHLDHPYQANDNLSGVACLVDLAKRLKSEHTIKIVFCPETIGSIAFGYTQDYSKADFVIAVDICGNDHPILLQKSFNPDDRINRVAHCALQVQGKHYRKGAFRNTIGSDEYFFNDPKVGIPGLMLSTYPYPEYHTSADTPEKINYDKIKETGDLIQKIIEIYEKDYIPERLSKGPIMRSHYGIQSPSKPLNLAWDYFFYYMDGKRTLAELCCDLEMNFDLVYETLEKLVEGKELIKEKI